ncbi:MAG: metallophosphoesterase [Elusimicrobiota bacterium]|jgi:predicted phosphodiesterase
MRIHLLLSLVLLATPGLGAKEKSKAAAKTSSPVPAADLSAAKSGANAAGTARAENDKRAAAAAVPAKPAPAPACERCVAVYGDTRTGEEIHKTIVKQLLAAKPTVVLHTGDFVDKGDKTDQWKSSLSITKDLRAATAFYPIFGNHDVGKDSGATPFFEAFPALAGQHWYSFERWGTRFIGIDTEAPLAPGTTQYAWLEGKLASRSLNDRAVVFMHDTVFSSGYHGASEKTKDLPALFEKYKVSLVFTGHDHVYERSEKDGVVYVVTGGGGAPLYPKDKKNPYSKFFASKNHYCMLSITPDAMRVEAFTPDGKKLDEVIIKK